jgi:predicted dehydrogenase
VIVIRVDQRAAAALMRRESPAEQSGPAPGIAVDKPKVEDHEPLRAEIEAFLGAVRGRGLPPVSLTDGRRVLALALDINASIREHHARAGLGSIGRR